MAGTTANSCQLAQSKFWYKHNSMTTQVKIRLLTSISGAAMHPAGSIIETSVKEATGLISAGFAELYEEVETAQSASAETRQTAARKPRKRRTSKKK